MTLTEDWAPDLASSFMLDSNGKAIMNNNSSPNKINAANTPSSLHSGSHSPSNHSPSQQTSASPNHKKSADFINLSGDGFDSVLGDVTTLGGSIDEFENIGERESNSEKSPRSGKTQGGWIEASEDGLHVYVLIEDRYCGGLIGRGGKSIDTIRNTGASICLQDRRLKFQNHLPKRALKIRGDEDDMRKAILATAQRLLEVKAANIAYKNGELAPTTSVVNPTYEITILSPEGLLNEEFRSHSHIVVESHNTWELIDIWGNGDRISNLTLRILNESGLGKAHIDESKLTTAITKKNRNNNDNRRNLNYTRTNNYGNSNRNNDRNNDNNNYRNNNNNNHRNNNRGGRNNNSYNNNNRNSPSYNNNNNHGYGNNGGNYNNRNSNSNGYNSNNNSYNNRNNNSNYNNDRNNSSSYGNNNNNDRSSNNKLYNSNANNNNNHGQNNNGNNNIIGSAPTNNNNNRNNNNQQTSYDSANNTPQYSNTQGNYQQQQYASPAQTNQGQSTQYTNTAVTNYNNNHNNTSYQSKPAYADNTTTTYGYTDNTNTVVQNDVWTKPQSTKETWQNLENNVQYSAYGGSQTQANQGVSTYFTSDIGKYYGNSPNIAANGVVLNHNDIWEDV